MTGSLAIALAAVATLLIFGGMAVVLGVPTNTLREKAQNAT
jgi:ACS family phthalate transporter-like MFS transporter